MAMRMRALAAAMALSLLLGCGAAPAEEVPAESAPHQGSSQPEPPLPREPEPPGGLQNGYIQSLVEDAIGRMTPDGPEDWQRVQAAYRFLIANTRFADPVGLDAWRWRGGQAEPPPYLENRALSPLAFGVGSCEDYAAAMTLLLRGMGFEAEYLPGLTVSVHGGFVDHAWTLVKLGGAWYHLDPQLEGNVMAGDRLTYRYFLKTDQQMAADHLWGERWLAFGKIGDIPLTGAQAAQIRELYTPAPCDVPFEAPPPEELPHAPPPDLAQTLALLDRERADYEAEHGPLGPVELNVSPPVFGAQATPASGFHAGRATGTGGYGRSFLSGAQAALYDQLAGMAADWRVNAPEPAPGGISPAQAEQALSYFLDDHPECYWAGMEGVPGEDGLLETVALTVEPPLTPVQARQRQGEIEAAADAMLREVPHGDGFLEVTAIHDALAGAVRYDASPGLADAANLYGALVLRRGICDAYSRGFQYLAQRRGLDCVYVNGATAWGAAHAWNAVRLPDGWYYVDTTWDRGREGVIYHDYLLVTPGEMDLEHHPRQGQYPSLPREERTAQNYYVRRGYAAENPGADPALLADAFLRPLADMELPCEFERVFLEIKVLSDEESFAQSRDYFVKHVFEVLDQMNLRAGEQGLALEVKATEKIKFSFNDTTRVLTLSPQARRLGD